MFTRLSKLGLPSFPPIYLFFDLFFFFVEARLFCLLSSLESIDLNGSVCWYVVLYVSKVFQTFFDFDKNLNLAIEKRKQTSP